jgi:hypothetical protein
VIERQKHVGRPGGDGQRRYERSHYGAQPFSDDGSRGHEQSANRHLRRKREPEYEFGRRRMRHRAIRSGNWVRGNGPRVLPRDCNLEKRMSDVGQERLNSK